MAKIGLIGDFDASVPAHQAIPTAIRLAADDLKVAVSFEWVPTNEIAGTERISHFDASRRHAGSMSAASSFAGLLTRVLTGHATMCSSG